MPTLFGRRYMRAELQGTHEVCLGIFVLVLAGSLCAALVVHSQGEAPKLFEVAPEYLEGQQRQEVAAAALPRLGLADWSEARDIRTFTPDTLYEKINGRADLYFQFNFKQLTFAKYINEQAPDDDIQIYLYNMGAPQNALGIYKTELPEHPEPADVGKEGYRSGPSVFFWKGPMYVSVMAFAPSLADICLTLARELAGTIEADEQILWAEVVLPQEDMVSGGLQYLATDVFGLDFLNEVYVAEYSNSKGRAKLFVHRAAEESAAGTLFESYTAFLRDYGELVGEQGGIVVGEVGGVIDAVFREGLYLAGVTEAADAAVAREEAQRFRDHIRRLDGKVPEDE